MIASNWLTSAPLLVPLATGLLTLAVARRGRMQAWVALLGTGVSLACALALLAGTADGQTFVTRFGGWAPPFAIAFRVDALGALMLTLTSALALVTLGYGFRERATRALNAPLIQFMLAGAAGAYAAADLFNLYVWFEVMLMAALGLIIAGRKPHHLAAGMKYLVLNVFGTLLLLIAVAGLYGLTGQLNFSALGSALAGREAEVLSLGLLTLLVLSLLIKAESVPFFFWLPASYPVLPPATAALFTALTTKVAAFAVLRVATQIFPAGFAGLAEALGWIAAVTMIVGGLGALHHYDIRRILAFHSVSQMGYILLAIALGGSAGTVAAVFFIVHHAVVKANLYLIGGMIARQSSFDLRQAGGLYRSDPRLALLFGITAAALVGIPPLSGFWAKVLIVREGLSAAQYVWVAAALATGAMTLLSMLKIWTEAFWKPTLHDGGDERSTHPARHWLAVGSLAFAAAALGIAPGGLLRLIGNAATSGTVTEALP